MLKTVGVDVKEKISELVELAYKGNQEAIEKLMIYKKRTWWKLICQVLFL
ncbi:MULTISPECIES: hypothetical protein [Bacillus]